MSEENDFRGNVENLKRKLENLMWVRRGTIVHIMLAPSYNRMRYFMDPKIISNK